MAKSRMLCINSIKVCRQNYVYSLNGIKFSNKMACVNGKILCINGIQFNNKVLYQSYKDQYQNFVGSI